MFSNYSFPDNLEGRFAILQGNKSSVFELSLFIESVCSSWSLFELFEMVTKLAFIHCHSSLVLLLKIDCVHLEISSVCICVRDIGHRIFTLQSSSVQWIASISSYTAISLSWEIVHELPSVDLNRRFSSWVIPESTRILSRASNTHLSDTRSIQWLKVWLNNSICSNHPFVFSSSSWVQLILNHFWSLSPSNSEFIFLNFPDFLSML